jgi:hypothetical protein
LRQLFFIGDGLTSGGVIQQFVVPQGATRLFLATMDGYGQYNNIGSFTVTVANAVAPESGTLTTTSSPAAGGLTGGGGSYTNGQTATVCATPNACYSFANWTTNGNVVSSSPCYTFAANGILNLVANFVPTTYSINTSASPVGGGTSSGDGTVNCGSNVTVAAAADAGYQFANWTQGGSWSARRRVTHSRQRPTRHW